MKNEKLFHDNERLIWAVIYDSYKHMYDLHDDMYQIGAAALWRASEGYDQSGTTKFSTYATSSIKREIRKFMMKENDTFIGFSGMLYNLTNLILKMRNNSTQSEIWEEAKKTLGDKVNHQMFNMCYSRLNNYTSLDFMLEDGNPITVRDKTTDVAEEIEAKLMCEYYIGLCDKFKRRLGERTVEIYKDYLSQKANGTFESFKVLGGKWGVSQILNHQFLKQMTMFYMFSR